ncbi:type IX secretion system sortase PorU [Winogradskyella maritima]|uniref:Type IX secretion system sortase PorU n=1 Tax=Winogradskyella maritima TaxID=1517766 RepID=A0ABV8ALK9_9FLAO|nr:type IX secretion system sortase PorU [Winogradskyella maritima]
MKKNFTLVFLFFVFLGFAQQKDFTIQWDGTTVLQNEYGKMIVPHFSDRHFSYHPEIGLTYYDEWAISGSIDDASLTISNVSYSPISKSELKDLDVKTIPSSLNYSLKTAQARNKTSAVLQVSPIINDNGVLKKVERFSVSYNQSSTNRLVSSSRNQPISDARLSNGDWFRFYVEKTGVYRLSRNFLSQLGLNVNDADPRNVKIYGFGGRMLPLVNAAENRIEAEENAIQFVGEDDGSIDNNDYILFYAEGPDQWSQESNTNLNLYTDKVYYYVALTSGSGKRIQNLVQPEGSPVNNITTFDAYQYYEIDEINIAKLGRRWFSEKFDIVTERSYEFEFPNLVTSEPVNIQATFGSISESPTSMDVTVNGALESTVNFPSVDLSSSNLASGGAYFGNVNASSDVVKVDLTYNNNGNPSAESFLDYINVRATRQLQYEGEQLIFTKLDVASQTGIAQYTLSNSGNIDQVWDVTDRFNIRSSTNSESASDFSIKATAGEARRYIAFSENNTLEPQRDNTSRVANQNLKGTIFNNAQGQFEDIDYIILTPEFLRSQAERLANINRQQYNLNVKVVSLSSIYSEFSTGNQDIAAIRNFIRYVYDNASSPDQRIQYLCLFGDASYDYKDRLRNNTNIVPSWFSNNSFSLVASFISDDYFGILDPGEGGMTISDRLDLATGRILVENLERAKDIVDKIEAYYQPESFGSWRNNLLLISDDVDAPFEEVLQATTDQIAEEVEDQKPFFNVIKVHSDSFQQQSSAGGDRYPEATDAIKDAINVGALVVNYFGHGGEDGLAGERIFDRIDAQQVNNNCRFNCFITVTCEYTKFDDPGRDTAGEFTFWNKKGGAVSLITTTRQIFVGTGTRYNTALEDYLFAYGSNDYPSIAEALRQTKQDPLLSGDFQKRLVFFIGDPAMKLAVPQPNIRLTQINDVALNQNPDILESLDRVKLSGEVTDANGNLLTNYNGIVTTTVFDKEIERSTLANDGTRRESDNSLIVLDFTTLGETIFNGQATVTNGRFDVNFVVPKDIGIPVGNGKVSFYAKQNGVLKDQAGSNFDIQVGGINENAEEDNIGPVINLFMNDENFVSGGITNEAPSILAKLQDDNGINTASGIGHDITAILDGDETNPIVLNDYYTASVDDFTSGTVTYALRDIEPGLHTLTFKAWDVYNNSSSSEIQFLVFNNNEELVIDNVLNYPNPFVDYTEFWFNHNSADVLDVSVQIFTVSGKLVKTINGQTNTSGKSTSTLSRDLVWDGRDDFGDKIGKGVYVYKLKVKSQRLNKQVEKIQKLVIL